MKTISSLFLAFMTTLCFAGYYEARDGNIIRLQLSENPQLYGLPQADIDWQNRFLKKIKYNKFIKEGGTYKTFLLSNHQLYENGKQTKDAVFVEQNNHSEIIVNTITKGRFFVDINKQSIVETGTGGISFILHPSKKALTVLLPEGGRITGIAVEGYPESSPGVVQRPIFKENSIEWW